LTSFGRRRWTSAGVSHRRIYPALWSAALPARIEQDSTTPIASPLAIRAPTRRSLTAFLNPTFRAERTLAQVEGWILGFRLDPGAKRRDDSGASRSLAIRAVYITNNMAKTSSLHPSPIAPAATR